MKRVSKISSGLYAYLQAKGVLTDGTDDEIVSAKAEYWKQARNEWRRNKRKSSKCFDVYLNNLELGIITKGAKQYGYSRVAFIKYAAIAYANKKSLIPRLEILYEIKELLAINYDALLEIVDKDVMPARAGFDLLRQVESLEKKVLNLLFDQTTAL